MNGDYMDAMCIGNEDFMEEIEAEIRAELKAGRADGLVEGEAQRDLSVRMSGRDYVFKANVPADVAARDGVEKAVNAALNRGLAGKIAWGPQIRWQIEDHSRFLRDRGRDESIEVWF
ncbi:hypothetical protein BB934_45365 (plasmid) [Microvirga ossetica]|uniref:Uncharacterized protein n=1 Tax=Microvirga ossetica TaxID=1882682 RepID=A0A1B2EZQ2_9HYPH|nr:hypothetical protein [Microvirga ossetica]ANY85451.1 hypothetical protein BB934_45365 [Microvirga ossetica]